MSLFCITLSLLICAVLGEHTGYPPKGWKPDGPQLQLPTEYGSPDTIDSTTEVNDNYDSSTTQEADDFLKVQELPGLNSYSEFSKYQRNREQPYLLSPSFAPIFRNANVKLNKVTTKNIEQAYGLPPVNNLPEIGGNNSKEIEEETNEEDSNEQGMDDNSVIALANANNQRNILQSSKNGETGQYYILLPDNSLQKVKYSTVQTKEDRQNNGFSAQLKYYPVEAIKDPVFGHDSQGKLTRLLK
ncbi:unnamed protein product [Diamesa tonsa]